MTRCAPFLVLAILVASLCAAPPAAYGASLADTGETLKQAAALVERAAASSLSSERETLVSAALKSIDDEPDLAGWTWLREPLVESPPDLERAKVRLAAAADLGAEPARVSDTDAQERLREVLAGPKFVKKSWIDSLPGWLVPVALLVRALLDLIWNIVRWPIDRLIEALVYLFRSWWIMPIGLLFALGVVLLYRYGVQSVLVRQAEVAAEPVPLPPTAIEALSAARQQAELRHYREACHFVLLSALIVIEEHGETRFDPSATNREHLWRAQAAARPAVARALAPLVSAFDNAWYGADAVTEADYVSMLDLASRVREAAA